MMQQTKVLDVTLVLSSSLPPVNQQAVRRTVGNRERKITRSDSRTITSFAATDPEEMCEMSAAALLLRFPAPALFPLHQLCLLSRFGDHLFPSSLLSELTHTRTTPEQASLSLMRFPRIHLAYCCRCRTPFTRFPSSGWKA